MNRMPSALLVAVSLGLCGLSVVQWRREDTFRTRLREAATRLEIEATARREAVDRASAFEQEIRRLTQLRADTEAKLLAVTDELTAVRARLDEGADAVDDRNRIVEAQNAAIAEANARLEKVTAERDRTLEELQARTRAYNELMTRSNAARR